jgi:exonuclease SbcC
MRPIRLELEGFGAFVQRTVIDLDDVEVFALVGPTGAGKSTVLDAVCFALYGNVPRYDDQRLVGAAMSLGANETRVRLTFAAGGRTYDAVRVVRRSRDGKIATKEARLEQVGGRVLAGRASEMTAAVEQVVGLGFEHFTRCVVLPQGAFARFLHDKPAERQQLLVQLLDLGVYERMAAEANRRAREAAAAAEVATRSADRLAHATEEALVAAAQRLDAVREAGARLAALIADDEHTRSAELAASGAVAQAELAVRALDGIRTPDELASRADALRQARTDEQAAATVLEESSAHLEAARRARISLGDRSGADAVLAAQARRRAAVAERELLARECAAAETLVGRLALEADEAVAAAERAVAAMEQARVASAAHAVREHLVAGAPCPVCEQVVAAVPSRPAPPAWQAARDEAQRCDQRRAAVVERVERARQDLAAAAARAAAAADVVARLDAEIESGGGVAAAEARRAELEQAETALALASAAAEAARSAHLAAQRATVAAQGRLGRLGDDYHRQRDAVAALDPPPPASDLAADWQALADWAVRRRRGCLDELADARRGEAVLAEERRRRRTEAREVLDRVELSAGDDLGAAREALVRADAAGAVALDRLRSDARQRQADQATAAHAREAAAVARSLAQLLSASGFERWLVTEATDALVSAASSTLSRLSGGQYSLAAEPSGELTVIDHANAGERRNVRTLSGGETFQAALSLALALADQTRDQANRSGASLDSLFLDEGFGTLDPDSLDVVAATIEALGGEGRMVGVITHVRDLASRLPVRFEVSRTPTGSSVRRELG